MKRRVERLLRRCWVIWTNWQTARQVEKARQWYCHEHWLEDGNTRVVRFPGRRTWGSTASTD